MNYLKLAFRMIARHKVQSLTGIFSLAFALACFVPALYWMNYETSYDSSYPDASHIYRIYAVDKQSGQLNKGLSKVYETKLRERFPAFDASTLCMSGQEENCRTEQVPYIRLHLLYAENSFFQIFPQTFICGNTQEPLSLVNQIVLTETVALRLFGSAEQAIGQRIQNTIRSDMEPYTVTAVVKDPPRHSNFTFDAILRSEMQEYFSYDKDWIEEKQWGLFLLDLYVHLNPEANRNDVAEQLSTWQAGNPNVELRMMPIADIRYHLNSETPFTLHFINLFLASGVLLLLAAAFNFLNLHIDLFRQRNRELRLRAVNGASNRQLIMQMLTEISCSLLLALLLAAYFVWITQPVFVRWLDIEIQPVALSQLFLVCSLLLWGLVALISLFVFYRLGKEAHRPASVGIPVRRPVWRQLAVTVQLAVSLIFIVAASVVMLQMRFVDHKQLGFDRNGLIQLAGFQDYSGKVEEALCRQLSTIPQIEVFSDANFSPSHQPDPYSLMTDVSWQGKPSTEKTAFRVVETDEHFAETFRLTLLQGEWWKEGQTEKVVLNEEAVRVMGLDEPVGTVLHLPSWEDGSPTAFEVVGVVRDFHLMSLRNSIQPALFVPQYMYGNVLYLRVAPGQEMAAIQRVMKLLPDIDPTLADVRLTLVGDLYDRLNASEQVGLKLFSILAAICLLVSLFGIYAVATTATQRRRKEIAIRKVVGAEAGSIVRMFFREYATQVVIAALFALPIAYLIMRDWLSGYAYRTEIPLWLLMVVLVGVISIVLFTVTRQVLHAANGNPAEVVKSE